jgi:hypothetical protein
MKQAIRNFFQACAHDSKHPGADFIEKLNERSRIIVPLQNHGTDCLAAFLNIVEDADILEKGFNDTLRNRRRNFIAVLEKHGFTLVKVECNSVHEIYSIDSRLLQ